MVEPVSPSRHVFSVPSLLRGGAAGIVLLCAWQPAGGHAYYVHFEARMVHPLTVSADGGTLLAVNVPDGRLSVFDVSRADNPAPVLIAEIPVGLEPVTVRLRTPDEAWVVNEVSDTISVVSLSRRQTVRTIPVPDEPADVVFAAEQAFVSCSTSRMIRVLNPETFTETAQIPLEGISPRALAVSADGAKVYAAFLLSGNGTAVLPAALAPPPPAPENSALPPAPQTALIVSADDARLGYTLLDRDIAVIDVASKTASAYHGGAGTTLFSLAVHPGDGALWIANTEARNLTRFESALRGHVIDSRVTRMALPAGTVTAADLNPGIDYTVLPNPAAKETALSQPAAMVWNADGTAAWVAAFNSDRVARLDANGAVQQRVDLRAAGEDSTRMRGPRGLALHPSRPRLYVMNKLMNSVTAIDTASGAVLAEVPVSSVEPVIPEVKSGRGFFFDARLSGNGTMSCASCHIDGGRDGLAWDLGDPAGVMTTVTGRNLAASDATPRAREMHPMKGPMLTPGLRGLLGNDPFQWRGDRVSLAAFSSKFITLGGGAAPDAAGMMQLEGYLFSLKRHPNPWLNLNRSLPATVAGGDPAAGRQKFSLAANRCTACHPLPRGSNSNIDDRLLTGSGDHVENPVLAGLYERADTYTPAAGGTSLSGFGFNHDGAGADLPVPHRHEPSALTATDAADLRAFLLSFDHGVAPATGHTKTVTTAETFAEAAPEITIMENEALGNWIDMTVRGRLGSVERAFIYDPFERRYYPDLSGHQGFTRAQLGAALEPGDVLHFMGVPAGLGLRTTVDRDDDFLYDGEEVLPVLTVHRERGALELHWNDTTTGWLPESADHPAGPWMPLLQIRHFTGGLPRVEVEDTGPRRFYRLRRTW